MKFSNYLVEIAGVSIFPIISLLIFVVFFVTMMYFVLRMNKNTVSEIANLPLESKDTY